MSIYECPLCGAEPTPEAKQAFAEVFLGISLIQDIRVCPEPESKPDEEGRSG